MHLVTPQVHLILAPVRGSRSPPARATGASGGRTMGKVWRSWEDYSKRPSARRPQNSRMKGEDDSHCPHHREEQAVGHLEYYSKTHSQDTTTQPPVKNSHMSCKENLRSFYFYFVLTEIYTP